MKKFGTPIGAGPGSANEKEGFDGDGTPPLPLGFEVFGVAGCGFADGFDGFDVFFLALGFGLGVVGAAWVDVFCLLPWPVGCGGFPEGVVVLVVVLDVDVVEGVVVDVVLGVVVDVVLGVVLEVVLGVVVDVVDGVVVDVVVDEQDSVTDATGPLTGSGIEDSGVPGGTFTVKLVCCPVGEVTVTTQVSAEAAGSITNALTTSDANTATTSFRILNTRAGLLPACASVHAATFRATVGGTLLSGGKLFND